MSLKAQKIPCGCCSIFFESTICPQCQVAGCATTVGQKKHKCKLQGNLMAAMEMSEFQVRAAYAELQTKYAELLAEAQRLARIIYAAEASHPERSEGSLDAAGVDPHAQRGKVSMLEAARQ